jgi:enoyl-CoA hydratase/carnithine racemase
MASLGECKRLRQSRHACANDENPKLFHNAWVNQTNELLTPLLCFEGSLATITLRRPSQHNRLDPQDLSVLSEHITSVESSVATRLLVLTGSGNQTFCSGYTVEAIVEHLDERFEHVLNQLENCAVPTLCILNGNVYGGGIDLALCCDFRLGLKGMSAFMPAARFALHYHPSGLRRFTQSLGAAHAKQLLLTGMALSAEELLQAGVVMELHTTPMQMQERVSEFLSALEQTDPHVVRTMKQHINAIAQGDLSVTKDRSRYLESLQSTQLRERLAAHKPR